MMFKKMLSVLLALTLIFSLSSSVFAKSQSFSDVPADAWEAEFVYDLADRGIVNGNGDGTFGPRNKVTRAEYAKMLVKISDTPLSTATTTPYVDVPAWAWYFPYVNSSLRYITGYVENGVMEFRPDDAASREDVIVALVKALNIDLSPYSSDPSAFLSSRFNDVESISIHNRVYIAAAVDYGYVTGNTDGTFRGQDSIIRAEVSAILCRAFPSDKLYV